MVLTIIDLAMGWFDMTSIETKYADIIANKLETTWLPKYPRPTQVVLDRGTDFMAEVISLLCNNYNITHRPITTKNPQANKTLEQAHQTIRNIICSFQLNKAKVNMDDPWEGILLAVIFAMQSTVQTTLGTTPIQLVFGQDAILNLLHKANWQLIKLCKQELMDRKNKKENKKCVDYTYTLGKLVLVKNKQTTKFGKDTYQGPWEITAVNGNGTLSIKKGYN